MKRLFVRPEFRGTGLGRKLVDELLIRARSLGYGAILLDTLPSMGEAQDLYRKLGFVEIPPYYPNPVVGARYLKLTLSPQ
jgi:ribosomal protein S18 acetylase RimI-like enzyme